MKRAALWSGVATAILKMGVREIDDSPQQAIMLLPALVALVSALFIFSCFSFAEWLAATKSASSNVRLACRADAAVFEMPHTLVKPARVLTPLDVRRSNQCLSVHSELRPRGYISVQPRRRR